MSVPDGGAPPPTVFFLSDYGLDDEFVGVCRAVLRRLAPAATVVDLTHGVTPFDVRAGAQTLVRAVPHLGPGVVLAVVDPGVGTARRGVAVEAGDGRWFVAPDNGLVALAAERSGGITRAVSLHKPAGVPDTFDGRDVFAPAAAHLALGRDAASLGEAFDPAGLLRLPDTLVQEGREGGRRVLRAEVTWIDRFGNVQLAAGAEQGPATPAGGAGGVPLAGPRVGAGPAVEARVGAGPDQARRGRRFTLRRVRAFQDLEPGELGLLADANGRLALALREGSAAALTGAVEGGVVELTW